MIKFKKIWYVDVPNGAEVVEKTDNSWVHLATFDRRKDAVQYVVDHVGVAKSEAKVFITEGQQ